MKKIMAIVATMIACVAMFMFAGSAQATDPDFQEGQTAVTPSEQYQSDEEFARLSQDYIVARGTSDCTAKVVDIVIPNPGNPEWNFSGTKHVMKGGMNYRACGSYAKIDKVFYREKVTDNPDCGKWSPAGGPTTYQIDGYRMNGNAIANINPVMDEWNCVLNEASHITVFNLGGAVVYPTDPGSVKCIAFEARVLATGDDSYGKSNSLCVNFSR